MRFFLLVLMLNFPVIVFSQSKPLKTEREIKGTIEDQDFKKALAYVNIGIVNKSSGTVSNVDGGFYMNINGDSLDDTIRFSLVGYVSQDFKLKDFLNTPERVIYLKRNIIELSEVKILSRKNSYKEVGRKSESGFIQATFNPSNKELLSKLGTEIGMRINYSGKSSALLKNFNWYFSANNFDLLKFRINVYSIKNGLPDSSLLKRPIYVDVVNSKQGWNSVSLEDLDMNITSDFIISLEWIESKIDNNKLPQIWIPGALSPFSTSYYRNGSQDKWQKAKVNISCYVTLVY